ncbi:MAG TPA: OmpA family protein [Gemmatimonadaceae bacterium]|nr:OmpA family protein [Gemmatimonadaceae bacterium]
MQRTIVFALLVSAATVGAQQPTPDTSYAARNPGWTNALEIGLYPTIRHYTPDVGYKGLWGGGGTATLGYHFAPIAAIELGYSDTWNPDIVSNDRGHPLTQLATASVVLEGWTHAPVVPYVSGGIGYNWFQFHLPSTIYPGLDDIRPKGFWVWHPAAGFKVKLSYSTALRAEANMDVAAHRRATAGGFLGISFFPGAQRPAPRVVHIPPPPPPPPIHDTTVVTRVDTVQIQRQVAVQHTVTDTSVLLVLQDVNFAFGKSDLRPRARPVLQRAAQQLNSTPNVPIMIEGFTDSVGSDTFNYKLGMARATSVRDFLVQAGVDPNRISVSSGGKTNPVAPNSTAAGRALNRRVVIRKNVQGQ